LRAKIRFAALGDDRIASPAEVLVSGAVPMLVAGSGIAFGNRGEYELEGVSHVWRLFAVKG